MPNYKAFFDAAFGSIEETANMSGISGMKQKRAERPLFRRFFDEAGLAKRHETEGKGMANAEVTPQGITPMDSRLLSREHLVNPGLAEALEKAMPMMEEGQLRGNVVGGNKVFTTGNATAVTPAWRKAYVHLIATGRGTPDATCSSLKELAKDSGAYSDEVGSSFLSVAHTSPLVSSWRKDVTDKNGLGITNTGLLENNLLGPKLRKTLPDQIEIRPQRLVLGFSGDWSGSILGPTRWKGVSC